LPIRYVIDKGQKTVFTSLYGTLTAKEAAEHHHRLGDDPDFDPTYKELIDGEAVDTVTLNIAGIVDLSRSCPFLAEAKRAIYSTDKQLYYGLARMFQTLAGGVHGDIRVFKKLDEATDWLGVTKPCSRQE